MSVKTAQRNGQNPTVLHKVDSRRDPEFVEIFEAAQTQYDPREAILATFWDTCLSLGLDPKEWLPEKLQQAYLCNFPLFDRKNIRVDEKRDDLHSWAKAHLANIKLKLIGKNGELDMLLSAMLACRLIGLTGVSGTGKTASINLMLASITGQPDPVKIVDCGAIYNKDQLLGHVDNGKFVPGAFNENDENVFLDEFTRLHPSLQNALVKVIDEGCIRLDGKIVRLHPNLRIFFGYNGLEDGGTNDVIDAILDRLDVVIQYKYVDDEATSINGRLTNANKNWKDDVGWPDEKFRGPELFGLLSRVLEKNNGKANRTRLVDLMSKAISQSRKGDLWKRGTELSERASESLARVGNAMMAVRGIDPAHLGRNEVLFAIAREVLENTAYNQLAKNPHREENKDELFEMFLSSTFEKFLASERQIQTSKAIRGFG